MSGKMICMVGCFENGIEIIDYLRERNIFISNVVTIGPELASKHQVSGYVDYRNYCAANNIEIYSAKQYNLKASEDKEYFRASRFDLLVIGGWNRLIPKEVLDEIQFGGIGVHGSPELLPVGRGRSPMNWALIEGKTRFIMHLFRLEPGVDDGEIIDVRQFEINPFDTIKTLYLKYSIVVKRMLGDCIPRILNNAIDMKPQVGIPEYYPKRTPEDGLINWDKMDVREVYNFIRAQTKPYPGAYGFIDGTKVVIWKAMPFDQTILYSDAKYGQIVEVFSDCFLVNCRGGLLLVEGIDSSINVKKNMIIDNGERDRHGDKKRS